MKDFSFLLQGFDSADDHYKAIRKVLSLSPVDNVLISVAFVNHDGVDILSDLLACIADKVSFYIGIDNSITSIQAIRKLLKIGIRPYCVITGAMDAIFHPKVYLANNNESAILITGSANMTRGGILSNIEASFVAELDMHENSEKGLVDSIYWKFDSMRYQNPRNVILVDSEDKADELLEQGFLADESIADSDYSGQKSIEHKTSSKIGRMNLVSRKLIKPSNAGCREDSLSDKLSQWNRNGFKSLIWESNPLSKRDLSVPDNSNTHPTGSMLLKKGNSEITDFRSYFRHEAFALENWVPDSSQPHLESCLCLFDIVINGEYKGRYELRLRHNNDKDSKTYKQKNAMTSIQWGEARILISNTDLLGEVLRIYATDKPHLYLIEISEE